MYTAIALCPLGAERIVSNELKKLSLRVLETGFGRVRFKADLAGLWTALLSLRAADRVFLELTRYRAGNFDELFDGARDLSWEDWIPTTHTVRIDKVRSRLSKLAAETSIQGMVHKAIAEKLAEARGLARLSDWQEAAIIRVYLEKNEASLLLDISGAPLFRRGWRSEAGLAPLRETMAAAILLYSLWRRKIPLLDPLCGSGTFLAEALLYAWDIAPGLGRTFALSQFPFNEIDCEERVRADLRARIDTSREIRIRGADEDPQAVAMTQANLARIWDLVEGRPYNHGRRAHKSGGNTSTLQRPAGTPETWPQIEVRRLQDQEPPFSEGLLVSNPPWGERLGTSEEAEERYKNMHILRERFPDWKIAILTNHEKFEDFFGEKAKNIHEIKTGALSSFLYTYLANAKGEKF